MKTRKETITNLLQDLYIKKYRERISILCCMDDMIFKSHILRDWRFNSLYASYIKNTQDDISIEQFYSKELQHLYRFVYDCLLDMPNEVKPEHIYLDEKYPFKFEILKDYAPDLDDFIVTENTRHLRKIGKLFHSLSTEEIQDRFINSIMSKIKIIDEQEEIERNKNKVKIILKYDKAGKLIEQYYSRQECIEKNDLKKAALSLHLSGKRKTLNGYVYKEVIHYT